MVDEPPHAGRDVVLAEVVALLLLVASVVDPIPSVPLAPKCCKLKWFVSAAAVTVLVFKRGPSSATPADYRGLWSSVALLALPGGDRHRDGQVYLYDIDVILKKMYRLRRARR